MSQIWKIPYRLLRALWSLLGRIFTFPLYVLLSILVFIDNAAYWSDKRFNTRFRKPKITVPELEKLIDTNLPIGSSVAEVLAFLKLHNLPHSEMSPKRFIMWTLVFNTANLTVNEIRSRSISQE